MNLFEYTYNLVRQIPRGRVSTYGEVAKALGDIIASRAVGRMMNQNPNADNMPCYKIVYSDGRLGGFGLGIDDKIRRLKNDNIIVDNGKIVDFKNILFNDFKTDYPLKKLRQEQIEFSKKITIEDDFNKLETIAGFDVAYPQNEFDKACGSCVVLDYKTKEVIEEKIVFENSYFPYIFTYFSYRELPFVEKLYKSLKTKPTVIMLDGNGILHPFSCGFASHAGLKLNQPTIGVAKSKLSGVINNDVVLINDKKVGLVLYTDRSRKPLFISPGYKISINSCMKIVSYLQKYKLPEPLRLAHILATQNLTELR